MNDFLANIADLLVYRPDAPMLFSSGTFWLLFLLFLPIYSVLSRYRLGQQAFVVAFSLYFYYKCSGWFVGLLAATSMVDWLLSHAIARSRRRGTKRLLVALSLTCSLGVLAVFKYANFALWNWAAIVHGNFHPLDIILPVGISFYTFQSVSYIIDVYRGRVAPTATWLHYAFYLTFFPALVAGPIVRADRFLPQVTSPHRPNAAEIWAGLWLIILGVVKKAVIADYIAGYNDLIFDSPGAYTGFETLMGIAGYTMQIYCDFSGYSDMAIGLAAIMGFRLEPNFNFPYKARNLTDFWHRWHISLSTWLRDYVYIPLGGNRRGRVLTYVNLMATMLIGGLWHGAAWRFVFWGGMHGLGLVVHKALRRRLERVPDTWAVRAVSWLITTAFVALLWVYFRADSWESAATLIASVFTRFSPQHIVPFVQTRLLWIALMGVIITAHALPTRFWAAAQRWFVAAPWVVKWLIFVAVVQITVQLAGTDVAPFIYFQF